MTMNEEFLSSSPTSVTAFDYILKRRSHTKIRKVRFADTLDTVESSFVINEYSYDEQNELWWNRNDLENIMSKALLTASEARKHAIVTEALDQAVRQSAITSPSDDMDLDDRFLDMPTVDRALRLWCQYGHSRRGLEKYTSRLYHQYRKKLTRQICNQVVSLSTDGADPELIRKVSERTSRPSVILARMMAAADFTAAMSCANPVMGEFKKSVGNVSSQMQSSYFQDLYASPTGFTR